jgi:drug/metabolite transporter (DMT)-like permease
VMNSIIVVPTFIVPHGINVLWVICSAVTGFLGQVFMTVGYKYISAKEGSLVSGSRIIFAGILGIAVFSELISVRIISGGLLIIFSIIGISLINYRKRQSIKANEEIDAIV